MCHFLNVVCIIEQCFPVYWLVGGPTTTSALYVSSDLAGPKMVRRLRPFFFIQNSPGLLDTCGPKTLKLCRPYFIVLLRFRARRNETLH